MNKLLLALLFIVPFVVAQEVMILNFHYDRGNITLLNSTKQYGFYPDRIIQDEGYTFEALSNSETLYTFTFKRPNEIIADGGNEHGELFGGRLLLDRKDFSFVIPYYEDMDEIRIYNENNDLVSSIPFETQAKTMRFLLSLLFILVVAVGGYYWYRHRSSEYKNL